MTTRCRWKFYGDGCFVGVFDAIFDCIRFEFALRSQLEIRNGIGKVEHAANAIRLRSAVECDDMERVGMLMTCNTKRYHLERVISDVWIIRTKRMFRVA